MIEYKWIKDLKIKCAELERYKKAAHFHNFVLMEESNGNCKFFGDTSFLKSTQATIYRAISEAVNTELQLEHIKKALQDITACDSSADAKLIAKAALNGN